MENHYVRMPPPRHVKIVQDERRTKVLRVEVKNMDIRRCADATAMIELVQRLYCEEIETAFKRFLYPPEKRRRGSKARG